MLATVLGLLGDFPDTEALLKIVFLVTFLVGIIQIGCGLLKLGDLFHFVSYSVTVGLTTGAGLLIAGNQLDKFCGLDIQKAPHLYLQVWRVLTKLHTLNLPTFFVGIITLAGLVLLKRFAPKFPAELIILIGISLLVFAFNLETQGVQLIGTIPYALLPVSFVHTDIRTVPLLLSGASSIAILGMVEALSIGKMIALSSGQQIDINQEFIGQGTANVIGSFFSCMTSSGSFTRSALNFKSGAKTRVSGILS
jgi:SulP family sulfate permease